MKYFNKLAGLAALSLTACGPAPVSEDMNDVPITQAGESIAMWYRFTLTADYEGKAVKFDQMVRCEAEASRDRSGDKKKFPGVYRQHPTTIGRAMEDGSFIVVRVPKLCMYNRRYAPNVPERAPLPGWKLPGPFSIVPLIIWNDHRPYTTRIESYISEGYYKQPRARVRNPKGTVRFMPLGYRPDNAVAVADQQNVGAYGEKSYFDPRTGARKGSILDGFQLWAMIPISDLNRYRGLIFRDPKFTHAWPRVESFKDARFVLYAGNQASAESPARGGNDFSSPMTMHRCLVSFMNGYPNISNLPPDPYEFDYFTLYPSQIRDETLAEKREKAGGRPFTSHAQLRSIQIAQKAACNRRLNDLRSLAIQGDILDPDKEVPGSLVYRFEALQNMTRFGGRGNSARIKLDGAFLDRGGIIEDIKSEKWYHIYIIRDIISE